MQQTPPQPQQGMVMNSSSPANVTTEQIQKYLDENKMLIMAILEHQSVGKAAECALLQAKLQENLMYLAKIADAQPPPPQPHGTPQPQQQQQQQLQGTLQPLQAQQWSSIQQEQLQQHYLMQASQGQGEWQQQQQQPSMYLGPKHPFQRSHQG